MKTALEILTLAQELIRDPKHWTQGAYARNEHGTPTGACNPAAVRWDASGAILKVAGAPQYIVTAALADLFKGEGVVHTNDAKGHAAVMAMFDRVREKAQALVASVPA